MQDSIKQEVGRDRLKIAVDAMGSITQTGLKYDTLANDCKKFTDSAIKSLEDGKKGLIIKAGDLLADRLREELRANIHSFAEKTSLGMALNFVSKLDDLLKYHHTSLLQELTDARRLHQEKLQKDVENSISAIKASVRGLFGRKNRIKDAMGNFDLRLEAALNQQLDIWVKERADVIYANLLDTCKALRDELSPLYETLKGHQKEVETSIVLENNALDQMADIGKRGPGNRFSLVDSEKARVLYNEAIEPKIDGSITRVRAEWWRRGLLSNTKLNTAKWIASALPAVADAELREKLRGYTFSAVLDRFYPEDTDKRKLFNDLSNLSKPQFWLTPGFSDPTLSYWIVAVHPSQQNAFMNNYERLLPDTGKGRNYARIGTPHEIVLYQLRQGYPFDAFAGLDNYRNHYRNLQTTWEKARESNNQARPVHCWLDGRDWEEVPSDAFDMSIMKWFIVARAFNRIFPSPDAASPTDKKNVSFLYTRGSNYYHMSTEEREEAVGRSLSEAIRNFSERSTLQQIMKKKIDEKTAEVGEEKLRELIGTPKTDKSKAKGYFEVLYSEIDKAKSTPDQREGRERSKILLELLAALKDYVRRDLQVPMV